MSAFGFRKPQDLPATIPVFPLAGALVFPRGALPLNIFEPRYLNMIDDALGSNRMIGMIQPALLGVGTQKPCLAHVGCVGRITTFSETEDGRYLITLTGVCRFRVDRELDVRTPYRQALVAYTDFADDLADANGADINRARLSQALRRYVEVNGFDADWTAVEEAPAETLVNALAALCPFEPEEKQALLEAETLRDRAETLVTLFQLNSAATGAGGDEGGTSLQ